MIKQVTFGVLLCTFQLLNAQTSNFKLIPDSGFRLDSATTRKVLMVNDTMFLYYGYSLDTNGSVNSLAIATDAPDYLNFTPVNLADFPLHNFHQLPNGNYIRYIFDQPNGALTSVSSTDHWTFSPDTGYRYYLDPSDNGTFGVSTVYNDSSGNVHLLYIGDMGGVDNVRHAVSTDGGLNFSFYDNNVCSDFGGLGGNHSKWDPQAFTQPDNSVRLFTMSQHGIVAPPFNPTGHVYTHISTDNGYTFQIETDPVTGDSIRLSYDDFTEFNNTSLNDPKGILLPDGRLRVFANGLVEQPDSSFRWQIISATSQSPVANIEEESNMPRYDIFPNPTVGVCRINLQEEVQDLRVHIINCNGQVLRSSNLGDVSQVTLNIYEPPGLYIVQLENTNGIIGYTKVIKQ